MKKSDLKRIIREEIQKLNEALISQTSGNYVLGPPLFDPPKKFHTACHYEGGTIYTNNPPCPDTVTGGAPGDTFVPASSDFRRPDRKVKDPNFGGGNTDPNPDDFSGGVGHPGGPGRSGKTRLREQADWDGNCDTLLDAYAGDIAGLEGLCLKCDTAGSYENNQVPSPCDCDVMSQGQMKPLKDFCRDKFPQLGIGGANSQWGIGSDDIPVDDPLDASTGTDFSYATPAEPSREPKLPDAKPGDSRLPFSILKRAGIKPKPRAPRKPRRR